MEERAQTRIVIVGGGLAGGLTAWALATPEVARRARVTLVEPGPLGGNHTWSFHDTDLPPDAAALVAPLVSHRWPAYDVRFPELERTRTIEGGYASVASADFAARVAMRLRHAGVDLVAGAAVAVEARRVALAGGRALEADVVIDARGPAADTAGAPARRERGYQKFLGLEIDTAAEHGMAWPTLMDATVEQLDGFRFVYALPLGPRRLLVEDTVYADGPEIDAPAFRARIVAWLRARGLEVAAVVREERAALPLPWTEPAAADGLARFDAPLAAGYRGGWFHPVTGYSLPMAARFALAVAGAVAAARDGDPGDAREAIITRLGARRAQHERQARFCRMLARLLFAVAPAHRRKVLARFHRLPDATIARFYALEMTPWDRLRIVAGRPPRGLSLRAALFSQAHPEARSEEHA